MKKQKMIEYEIHGKLWFPINENVNIEDYLDKLREIGEAEVVDAKIVERDE